jgi:hypothetical protein
MVTIFIHLLPGFVSLTHPQTFGPDVPVDTTTPGVVRQWKPNIAVDSKGTVGVVWVNQTATNYIVMFARSTDKGQTWQKTIVDDSPLIPADAGRYNPAVAFDTEDNPWVAWQFSIFFGNTYVTVAHSTDGGQTFGPAFKVPQDAWDNIVRTIAVDKDNTVYLPIYFYGLKCLTLVHGDVHNRNMGQISPPSLSLGFYPDFQSVGRGTLYVAWEADSTEGSDKDLIYFSKSVDAGSTFSDPVLVSSGPLEGIYGASHQHIVIDEIGTIYIVWSDERTGNRDIYLSKSTDYGASFFFEKRVNDITARNQTWPRVTYTENSGLSITYCDGSSNRYEDIYFTRSTDKGETFTESVIVTDSTAREFTQFPFGIAADDSGNVFITYIDLRYQKDLVFVTRVRFQDVGVEGPPPSTIIPNNFRLWQNHPNPFNTQTIIEYDVPKKGFVSLDIYNVQGERVQTLVNGFMSSGRYRVSWDGTNELKIPVASGLYFCRMETDKKAMVRKLVLLR